MPTGAAGNAHEQARPSRAEVARLSRRVAALESEHRRYALGAGDLSLDEFLAPVRAARGAWDRRRASGERSPRTIKVVRPSSVTLPATSGFRREPPRKPEDRQPEYLDQFDDRTLFYDAFQYGDDVWLSGPPVGNLREPLANGTWRVDGADVSGDLRLHDWGRTQRSVVAGAGAGRELTFGLGYDRFSALIAPNESDLFAGQRTIITKSKDNDLVWVKDFLRYYHLVHGVTGIVFYDNGSTRYAAQDVADAIAEVDGITTAVVVDWPFPFGPQGGPKKIWDSDYCQYGLLEHGRFRYLSQAAGVVSVDIDELVLADDNRPVFEHAAESETGVVMFSGYWMAKATRTPMPADRQRRFVDYHHRAEGTTTVKWAAVPGLLDEPTTQWRVHSVAGAETAPTDKVHHRHFEGVNSGWRYDRAESVARPGVHAHDPHMSGVLDLVFGASPGDVPGPR
ncbi:capsule biosynthesis protein CapZ [Streptomyces sp. CA-253872]|uniref:capsule biosynthesis protein CapZ n=1 Tax=Streptomyces sp. CA-253872 TaxID=3240067 RepID=UPI003D8EF714